MRSSRQSLRSLERKADVWLPAWDTKAGLCGWLAGAWRSCHFSNGLRMRMDFFFLTCWRSHQLANTLLCQENKHTAGRPIFPPWLNIVHSDKKRFQIQKLFKIPSLPFFFPFSFSSPFDGVSVPVRSTNNRYFIFVSIAENVGHSSSEWPSFPALNRNLSPGWGFFFFLTILGKAKALSRHKIKRWSWQGHVLTGSTAETYHKR